MLMMVANVLNGVCLCLSVDPNARYFAIRFDRISRIALSCNRPG